MFSSRRIKVKYVFGDTIASSFPIVGKIEGGDFYVEFGCGLRVFPYPDTIKKGG